MKTAPIVIRIEAVAKGPNSKAALRINKKELPQMAALNKKSSNQGWFFAGEEDASDSVIA
jgi:hypothetical protein